MSKSRGGKAKESGTNKGAAWKWKNDGSCMIGESPDLKPSSKIASFDVDDTIITRKSGAKFPKDANDWIFLNDKVSSKLNSLYKEGFKIVIFTNQLGIAKGHTNAEDIKTKVANIAAEMDI